MKNSKKLAATLLRGIPAHEYHNRPGLSSTTAKTLIDFSPLHAWTMHPAYGGKKREPTDSMDRGSIIHELVLGKGGGFAILDFDNYKTKAAQEKRDEARAAGRIPVLRAAYEDALEAARKITAGLARRGIVLDGESELGIEWYEDSSSGPVLCRGMYDHVWLSKGRILDLKIVENASPEAIEKSAERFGYAIQGAAYPRGLERHDPTLEGRVEMLFAFCEPEEPHAINLCRGDGMFRSIGLRRWRRAVETWGRCLARKEWPAYGDSINSLSVPMWALKKEEEQAA